MRRAMKDSVRSVRATVRTLTGHILRHHQAIRVLPGRFKNRSRATSNAHDKPLSSCPACRSPYIELLPVPSQARESIVDYFLFAACKHVWNMPADTPPPDPLTLPLRCGACHRPITVVYYPGAHNPLK